MVKGKPMIIHTIVIDQQVELLASKGEVSGYVNGVCKAPRPNIHGMLTCFRDNRKYDPRQIEALCMSACPHPVRNNKVADDSAHLDDCWDHIFNAESPDGEKYIEYSEE